MLIDNSRAVHKSSRVGFGPNSDSTRQKNRSSWFRVRASIGWARLVVEIKKASKSGKKKKKVRQILQFFSLKIAGIWPDLLESKLDLSRSPRI